MPHFRALWIQFDGFYLTRSHYSKNRSATIYVSKTGKIIAYTNVGYLSSLANNA